jgi:hypothetical protein
LETNILEVESSSSGECSDDSSDESDSIEIQSVSSLERDNFAPHLSEDDENKLAFATNEMRKGTVHECTKQLPDDIRACVRDRSQFSNEEIMQFREEQLRRVAKLAQSFIDSGEVDTWFKDADPATRHICRNVNAHFLKRSLRILVTLMLSTCLDSAVRFMAICLLCQSVLSPKKASNRRIACKDMCIISKRAQQQNARFIATLQLSEFVNDILEATVKDAEESRMSLPSPASQTDLDTVLLSRRFVVVQGIRPDGSLKLRVVDDATASNINPCCYPGDKIECQNIDHLYSLAKEFVLGGVCPAPSFWKADIKSAYRRIPIAPSQRWAATVAFATKSGAQISQHNAMFFGATGAVYSWDRIGELLAHIARSVLKLPLLRYVDDFFGVEDPSLVEHASQCFEKLMSILLGPETIAPEKLAYGSPLEILGVDCQCDDVGFTARPSQNKINKWTSEINMALLADLLHPGNAAKMAGRLSFGATHMFRKHGRAMLRPIFEHSHRRSPELCPQLRLALTWWREALQSRWVESRSWVELARQTVFLFADARGSPPHLAAVLISADGRFFTEQAPDHDMLAMFQHRDDCQIAGLEILAIALGLCTFSHLISHRHVQIYSDNKVSERAAREGTAKRFDHSCLAHSLWSKLIEINASTFVQRVPTDENVADPPSRLDFRLMDIIGATRLHPVLDNRFMDPSAWESLTLANIMS